MADTGMKIYTLAKKLFPICRSLTGDGVRETLALMSEIYNISVHEIPSGTQVFDWTIPNEWNINDAYISDSTGLRIVDFKENNLHVMGYSTPVDRVMTGEELFPFIHSDTNNPDAIPYVTSYYKENWGFCMSENQKRLLSSKENYHVYIDSSLKPGHLTYGEIYLPGGTDEEIFFSTYICHPSMANNELSGPCVAIYLASELARLKERRFSYRFFFGPETIGAIAYLSKNLNYMKEHVTAGYVLSCVGDNRNFSYISSRRGDTLADKTLKNILHFMAQDYKAYDYKERGSDERQYCAPGVDLPVCGFCRTKYWHYPEYHTSADGLSVISPEGLQGAFDVLWNCCMAIEHNKKYICTTLCEPQLGKHGLYPAISKTGSADSVKIMMDLLAYSDGQTDILEISNLSNHPISEMIPSIKILLENGLIMEAAK